MTCVGLQCSENLPIDSRCTPRKQNTDVFPVYNLKAEVFDGTEKG